MSYNTCAEALALSAALLCVARAAAQITTVAPEDTGEALCNPMMGWTLHYYSNTPTNYGSKLEPSDTVDEFPGLSTIYLRIPWSYIEPEEGVLNWSVVDGPAQRWIRKGKQVAFRFSCCESWMRYATPEWVARAGAKGHNFAPGKLDENGPFWEPDYDDPVFLEKLDGFLAAAAARYDGNPEVAFIDVGSFGVWGEGHTWSSTQLKYPASTIIKHIDLHLKHFKQTLLTADDDFSFEGDEAVRYSLEHGLTLRDDSILVQGGDNAYFHADMAQPFWPNLPVILECEHYGGSRDRGSWQDGSKYLQAVEDYHASYAAIHWWPREFLEENRDLIRRINMRLGYRIQLAQASWPTSVRALGRIVFSAEWRNAGVAPCYPGGFPAATLRDAKGGLVTCWTDESFDVRQLPVGAPGEASTVAQRASFLLPFYVRPGTYDLLVSVGTRTGTPVVALPLPNGDGERRYRLGTLTVMGDYAVTAGEPRQQDGEWELPLTWELHAEAPARAVPFCHFDRNGAIAFRGQPVEPGPEGGLAIGQRVEWPVAYSIPADSAPGQYEVYVGLWMPDRLGSPEERLIPDTGAQDRRVRVGTLAVQQAGASR